MIAFNIPNPAIAYTHKHDGAAPICMPCVGIANAVVVFSPATGTRSVSHTDGKIFHATLNKTEVRVCAVAHYTGVVAGFYDIARRHVDSDAVGIDCDNPAPVGKAAERGALSDPGDLTMFQGPIIRDVSTYGDPIAHGEKARVGHRDDSGGSHQILSNGSGGGAGVGVEMPCGCEAFDPDHMFRPHGVAGIVNECCRLAGAAQNDLGTVDTQCEVIASLRGNLVSPGREINEPPSICTSIIDGGLNFGSRICLTGIIRIIGRSGYVINGELGLGETGAGKSSGTDAVTGIGIILQEGIGIKIVGTVVIRRLPIMWEQGAAPRAFFPVWQFHGVVDVNVVDIDGVTGAVREDPEKKLIGIRGIGTCGIGADFHGTRGGVSIVHPEVRAS